MTKFIKLIFTYSEKEDSNGDKSAESDNDSVRNEQESLESADDESDDGIEEQQGLESDEKSLDKEEEEEEDVILISDQSDTEGELSSPANEDLN